MTDVEQDPFGIRRAGEIKKAFAEDPFKGALLLHHYTRDSETDGDTYTVSVVIKDFAALTGADKRLTKFICSNPGDEIVEVALTFPNMTDEQIDTLPA